MRRVFAGTLAPSAAPAGGASVLRGRRFRRATHEYIALQLALALGGARALREREDGQTLVEYVLILSLISIGVIGAMIALRNALSAVLTNIANSL